MPVQLRVIETMTSRGQSDVVIDASSPERAAAIITRAYQRALVSGRPVIRLPDGQSVLIDQGQPETAIEVRLLDEHGQEVRQLELPRSRGDRAKRE